MHIGCVVVIDVLSSRRHCHELPPVTMVVVVRDGLGTHMLFGFIHCFPSFNVELVVINMFHATNAHGLYIHSGVFTVFHLASIVFTLMEFNEVYCVFLLVSPTEAELSLLPPHEVYCVPLIHFSIPYVGSLHDISPPLTFIGGNTIWYGGIHLFIVSTHISSTQGHTIVCLGSYMLLHVSDFVLQVVKVIQYLVNAHNGCHVILCKSFLAQHDVQYIGYDIPLLVDDDGGGGCSCLHVEQFYTMQSTLLHFPSMLGSPKNLSFFYLLNNNCYSYQVIVELVFIDFK